MSLILEALKKSERQRRLGESPSLGSPIMAVRRRRRLLPVLVVLIPIGLAGLWWMQRERAPEKTGADVAAKAQVAAETRNSPAPAVPPAATPHANPAPPPQQKKAAIPALAGDRQTSQREKLRSGELVAANPQAGVAATIKESEPISAADPAAIAAAMGDARKSPSAPAHMEPALKAPAASTPVLKPAPTPAAEPTAAAGPSLALMWELPLATRRSLPEIKLSMHVFAAEPKQRFVIINGERRAEGDDFDGLKLIEIRTDGVVLEHEGTRFLYPRGGR